MEINNTTKIFALSFDELKLSYYCDGKTEFDHLPLSDQHLLIDYYYDDNVEPMDAFDFITESISVFEFKEKTKGKPATRHLEAAVMLSEHFYAYYHNVVADIFDDGALDFLKDQDIEMPHHMHSILDHSHPSFLL